MPTFNLNTKIDQQTKTSPSQHGHDESNKIVEDMEKTIAASLFDTYRVRNHLVPNPTNSKLIRLKK